MTNKQAAKWWPTRGKLQLVVLRSPHSTTRVLLNSRAGRYSSDCGLSPHQLYVDGFGTVLGYPGGPEIGAFGDRFVFDAHDRNFFSPLFRKNNRWRAAALDTHKSVHPGPTEITSVATCAEAVVRRRVVVGESVQVHDTIIARVRLKSSDWVSINLPLLGTTKDISCSGDRILAQRESALEITVKSSLPLRLSLADEYRWVRGPVSLVEGIVEATLEPNQAQTVTTTFTHLTDGVPTT